jgi:hypothetical protein
VTQAVLGLFVSNLFLSMALGVAMKRIWTLINTLQVLTHIPLLELPLTFPINAKLFLQTLYDISNVKLIPKAQILQALTFVFKKGADSEFMGEVGDFVMGAAFLVGISILLLLVYALSKKFER